MTGKKTSSKDSGIVSKIKKEMVNYIGPIFEELKTDFKRLDTKLSSDIRQLDTRMGKKFGILKGEIIHEVKVLLENDKRIEVAIEFAKTASDNKIEIKDLEERITYLEQDVKTIKAVTTVRR